MDLRAIRRELAMGESKPVAVGADAGFGENAVVPATDLSEQAGVAPDAKHSPAPIIREQKIGSEKVGAIGEGRGPGIELEAGDAAGSESLRNAYEVALDFEEILDMLEAGKRIGKADLLFGQPTREINVPSGAGERSPFPHLSGRIYSDGTVEVTRSGNEEPAKAAADFHRKFAAARALLDPGLDVFCKQVLSARPEVLLWSFDRDVVFGVFDSHPVPEFRDGHHGVELYKGPSGMSRIRPH